LSRSPDGIGLSGEGQGVEDVRRDEFCDAQPLAIPSVLRIDGEGYRYAVLKGTRRSLGGEDCGLLGCEVNPRTLSPITGGGY
jgi:hypothetical protein